MHLWYVNESGYDGRTLWATFNEGEGIGKKRSMGLVEGVSDLLMYRGDELAGIEVKVLGEQHEVDRLRKQAEWIRDVCGGNGGFCHSLEMFKEFVRGDGGIVPAWFVLRELKWVKTKTVKWGWWDVK